MEVEGETMKVNVMVPHASLSKNLRSLKGTKTALRTQGHGTGGGPSNSSVKLFKDVTNKIVFRPAIAKASRSITKVSGAFQKENIKIPKRAEVVWVNDDPNGRLKKSPPEDAVGGDAGIRNGSGYGRPPDPPDITRTQGEALSSPIPQK